MPHATLLSPRAVRYLSWYRNQIAKPQHSRWCWRNAMECTLVLHFIALSIVIPKERIRALTLRLRSGPICGDMSRTSPFGQYHNQYFALDRRRRSFDFTGLTSLLYCCTNFSSINSMNSQDQAHRIHRADAWAITGGDVLAVNCLHFSKNPKEAWSKVPMLVTKQILLVTFVSKCAYLR